MKEKIKIAVIGGSGVYTPGLLLSLVKNMEKLPGAFTGKDFACDLF